MMMYTTVMKVTMTSPLSMIKGPGSINSKNSHFVKELSNHKNEINCDVRGLDGSSHYLRGDEWAAVHQSRLLISTLLYLPDSVLL